MTTDDTDTGPAARPGSEGVEAWRLAAPAVLVSLAALIALYWETAVSIVAIWYRSETFAHGFVVVPVVAWLVWRQRHALARVRPRPRLGVALLIVLAGLGWLGAHALGVLVVEQLVFVAMIPLVVWALLGWGVVREILFPLVFLLFAVPMGEELISPLMDLTAASTVTMLRLTGIPVYVEGTFFTIPSGSWSVVEGCSGIRYLIASVTLGTLYAYLTYRSYWRRAVFIALSVLVPILANGMRAYLIVMIAHLSDHKLAHGIDHFIYGWVWFGVVMLILFWAGSFWRDDAPAAPLSPGATETGQPGSRGGQSRFASAAPAGEETRRGVSVEGHARRFAVAVLATLTSSAIAPGVFALTQRASPAGGADISLTAPPPATGWAAQTARLSDWEPVYVGMDAKLHQTYRSGETAVGLYVALYGGLTQGQELINSQNILIGQKHPKWRMPLERPQRVSLDDQPATVLEAVLRSSEQSFLVWRWNWIGGQVTVNPYLGKLLEAWDKLDGGRRGSAGLVVYTPLDGEPTEERRVLQGFVDAMLPVVVAGVEQALDR